MTAVPVPTAVICPFWLTSTTLLLLVVQTTFWWAASGGVIVATKKAFPPTFRANAILFSVTPVTLPGSLPAAGFPPPAFLTVTAHFEVYPPSAVAAVISVGPVPTARTTPLPSTTATLVLPEAHETLWFVASDGDMVAFNCELRPTARESVVGKTLTDVTETAASFTVRVAAPDIAVPAALASSVSALLIQRCARSKRLYSM